MRRATWWQWQSLGHFRSAEGRCPHRAKSAVSGLVRLASCLALSSVLSVIAPLSASARYVVTESNGDTLCERLAGHLNRETVDGRAMRLWVLDKPDTHALKYPKVQYYLTRELLSFPEFKRPPFKEIRLRDARELLELMGERDAFNADDELRRGYQGTEAFIAERLAGKTPDRVLSKTRPAGQRFYRQLEESGARVFRLGGGRSRPGKVILQVEFVSANNEPVSALHIAGRDLKVPDLQDSIRGGLISQLLVKWEGGYFAVLHSSTSVEINGREPGASPIFCRIDNHLIPPRATELTPADRPPPS